MENPHLNAEPMQNRNCRDHVNRLLHFRPIYQERIWGGSALRSKLDRQIPGDVSIGEAWDIVDRPDAQSIEPRSGKTLRQLLRENPEAIMGPGFDPEQPFPILVKWLDCKERLSLQVHPPKKIADQLGGESKTECWYIADATSEAALIVGLRGGVTRDQFEQAIEKEALEPLLHRFNVQAGQSILLESGRLHAIDAGNLILEIQENSDTTYRVYDWGRKGLDGKPRQLHVDESLKSIDFDDFEPQPNAINTAPGEHLLASCDQFRLRQINLEQGAEFALPAESEPSIVSLVGGTASDSATGESYNRGDNLLHPWCRETTLVARNPVSLLITDHFYQQGR
jgi:mannose-6-phosphate isomerase